MKFRLQYIVKSLRFSEREKIEFAYTKAKFPIFIEMRRLTEEEIKEQYKSGDILCTSLTEINISEADCTILRNQQNEINDSLRQTVEEIRDELYAYTKNTIHNFRWVIGGAEPKTPIRYSLGFNCSLDGIEWLNISPLPQFGPPMFGFPVGKNISDEEIKTISDLVESQVSEPICYELLCEAWNQKTQNPRSALVIGIAAAETGFKEFVSKCLPETDWLLSNVQSPPLIKMLKEFLPLIPTKFKIKGKVICPTKEIIKQLTNGIEVRNKIVHGKSGRIDIVTVHDLLKAVYDLLYLLDYYGGQQWAERHISYETKLALTK